MNGRSSEVSFTQAADPIAEFWKWFVKNQQRLRQFESDPDKYLKEFLEQARKVKPGLAIELEPPQNGIVHLIISANGNIELFDTVKEMTAKAPTLKGWKIFAFRQRIPFSLLKDMVMKAGNVQLDPQTMKFLPVIENGLLNIIIYVPGITDESYNQVAYAGLLLLDNVLGEYDCVTKVHSYDFHELPADTGKNSSTLRPLTELPAFVDEFHRKK